MAGYDFCGVGAGLRVSIDEFVTCTVGAEADADRVSLLLKELEGKDILEVIAAGKEKFASVPSGGGGGVVVSSGGGAGAPAAATEEKKEEPKEEPKEESDDVSFPETVAFLNYQDNCIRAWLACWLSPSLCCLHEFGVREAFPEQI